MRCRFCGTLNAEEEHRCRHCGRRLQASPYPVENSAAVPALQPVPESSPPSEDHSPPPAMPRQASLFGADRKVIPFESLAPARSVARRQEAAVRRQPSPASQTAPGTRSGQQSLDLRPSAPRQQTPVNDEAPIAPPGLRAKAAAMDAAVFAAGLALAGAAFHFLGGHLVLSYRTGPFYAGAVLSMVLAYHLFWCVLGREPAGMQCFRLRVLTFDGYAPRVRQRVIRFLAACLGLVALGLGPLWAWLDGEGLTWHDHISKTFPTVFDPNPSTFHRK